MPASFTRGDTAIPSFQFPSAIRLAGLVFAGLASLLPPCAPAEEGPEMRFLEREPWKEQAIELPPYPDGRHYLAVPLQIAGSRLEMFVDEPSLAIGEDGVVRYVMLLRAPGGGENLFYEGIRCSTREWRTYAYGDSTGAWRTVEAGKWAPIRDLGVERYRERLYRYYLCDPAMGTLRRAEMLRRMRYGLPADDRFQ